MLTDGANASSSGTRADLHIISRPRRCNPRRLSAHAMCQGRLPEICHSVIRSHDQNDVSKEEAWLTALVNSVSVPTIILHSNDEVGINNDGFVSKMTNVH